MMLMRLLSIFHLALVLALGALTWSGATVVGLPPQAVCS